MKEEKEFLRGKLTLFQKRIAELEHTLQKQKEDWEKKWEEHCLQLLEVLDAFEHLEENMSNKQNELDKSGKRLIKNCRNVHKKLLRVLENEQIEPIAFENNKASREYCIVKETRESTELENETILEEIKKGYIDKNSNKVLRKAEVITVLNE